jgi:hypothetical protein
MFLVKLNPRWQASPTGAPDPHMVAAIGKSACAGVALDEILITVKKQINLFLNDQRERP